MLYPIELQGGLANRTTDKPEWTTNPLGFVVSCTLKIQVHHRHHHAAESMRLATMPPTVSPSREVQPMRFAALFALVLSPLAACSVPHADAQQATSGSDGRYAVVPNAAAANIILVDTQTGRTWLMCNTKSDSTLSRQVVVDNNWCAMRVFGTATRP